MRQKHTLVLLAMMAVTGAVTAPPNLAAAWRLDLGDRHVVDRRGSEWNPLIHTVADTDARLNDSWPQNENYSRYGSQLGGLREHEASQSDGSGYGREYKSGSAGEESRYGSNPANNYFQKQSSAFPTAPYGEAIYGGFPTTPGADPLVKELSR